MKIRIRGARDNQGNREGSMGIRIRGAKDNQDYREGTFGISHRGRIWINLDSKMETMKASITRGTKVNQGTKTTIMIQIRTVEEFKLKDLQIIW